MSFIAFSNQYIFGLALLAAFVAGFFALRSRTRALNLELHLFEEWLPWLTISSLVISRLFALAMLDWHDILQTQWWHIFYFWDGQLNLWGAITGFIITLAILCKKYQRSFGKWADALSRPFFVMLIFGRLGNFFDGGIFYGLPTDHFPGITIDNIFFPLSGIRHHPIALYEALFALVIFTTGLFWKRNIIQGSRLCISLMIYAFWRFFLEMLRFDSVEIYENITWDQALSIIIFIFTSIAFIIQIFRVKNKYPKTTPSKNRDQG